MARRHIEMIEEYLMPGDKYHDYQYYDNHGILVRCKDCKYAQTDVMYHDIWCDGIIRKPDWFCADGERRDT